MADRIKDKVALVTGAGSIGTGWGMARRRRFCLRKVLCADINVDAATETAELIHIDDLRRRPVLA